LNTLQLAFAYAPQTDDEKVSKFLDTLKLSFEQVISELRNQQIEILIPHIGQKVDVEWMNLLTPSDEEHPSVKQVVGLGLKIDSQLVQPASVMV
jgi:molecular chaperone GrpE (heat shock protein)